MQPTQGNSQQQNLVNASVHQGGGYSDGPQGQPPLRSGLPLLDINGDMASRSWVGTVGRPGQTPRPPFPGKASENLSAAHTMEGPGQGPGMPGPWRMPRVNPWSPDPGLSYSDENPSGRPLSRVVRTSGSLQALRPQQPQLQTSKILEVRACTGLQGEGATIS